MTTSEYSWRCPSGTSYTPTATGTATATATPIPPKPTFDVPPGEAVCMRSCGDKANYLLVRKIVSREGREAGIQCIGPDASKCAWFTEDKCTVVAEGEAGPDPSYDNGFVCDQTIAGWW
jgi:hypothetical protein